MIIFDNKGFQTRSDAPNSDWTGEALYIVPDGSELAQKIQTLYPYYDFVIDGEGNLIDVTPTERPPEPEPEPDVTELVLGLSRIAAKSLGVDIELTPAETEAVAIGANLLPIADGAVWSVGLNLAEGTIVTHGGVNYQVIQGHISQAGWEPTAAPALFKKLAADYAEWEQPQGAHNAYMLGDKVTYMGKLWISTVNANTWAPGVYGWEEVTP